MDCIDRLTNSSTEVLVTGASGYLGVHCVKRLLADGYTVRGTVRCLSNQCKVTPLRDLAFEYPENRLQLVEADLNVADSWQDIRVNKFSAVNGCTYVLHVASPFPIVADESVVTTAVNGTLNVLKACATKGCGVKKVVLTSSCAAVNEGWDGEEDRVFTEEDWTNTNSKKVLPYARSKCEAEKAAWNFIKQLTNDNNRFAMTCINPTLIVGPILIDTQGTSITVIRRFLNNEMPAVPPLQLALVDVRDVATAHVRAMRNVSTDGHRLLVTAQPSFWFREIAKVLSAEFSDQGYWLPRFTVPSWVTTLYALFDAETRQVLARLNREIKFDNSKAVSMLGMKFTNPEKSLVEMAYSMIERGILPKKCGYRGKIEK